MLAEAVDGASAVAETLRHSPDVVLMDIMMPGIDGIEATRQVVARSPMTRVVILTTFDRSRLVYDALTAGRERVPAQGCPDGAARRWCPRGRPG